MMNELEYESGTGLLMPASERCFTLQPVLLVNKAFYVLANWSGPKLLYRLPAMQHPKKAPEEVSHNLMLCSSSTWAHRDWWRNGNRRFISPTGTANHSRQAAWGNDEHRRAETVSIATSDRVHMGPVARLVHLPTGTRTDMQAHTLLVRLLQHNGRLGRMCGRHCRFPPPFLAVWWFLPRGTCVRGRKRK